MHYKKYKEEFGQDKINILYHRSLFEYRRGHYNEEKDYICKLFLDELIKNTELERYDNVYLLIDSGSTVYPLFSLLCHYYWRCIGRKLLDKIKIYTNNIPGINDLLLYGRVGNDINANIIYNCDVIPGKIEGKYSAILGADSVSHLSHIVNSIKDDNKRSVFISIITGNYISIKDGLLWLGDYHGAMKDSYIYNSDWVYILSPLGKIVDMGADQINKAINENIPFNKRYKKLTDEDITKQYKELDTLNLQESSIYNLLPEVLIQHKRD